MPNGQAGVEASGSSNAILFNVISANPVAGVLVKGDSSASLTNNKIGTNGAGTAALGNGVGVLINGLNSTLTSNTISGNNRGVEIRTDPAALQPASNNQVSNNRIGTAQNGTSSLPNAGDGVLIAAPGNPVTGNTIAFNGGAGVRVNEGTGNSIKNSIFSNGGLGIDLVPAGGSPGPTPNDADDADSGPNQLQNFPVITRADGAIIEGTLQSTPNTTFSIEVFRSTGCDPSGFGEGTTRLLVTSATTDSSGNASFGPSNVVFPPGAVITATATDPQSNTSEFSQCFIAGP